MKIVLASDKNMKQYVKACKESIERFNYEVILYDLGGLGEGIKWKEPVVTSYKPLQKFPKKPLVILDCLKNHTQEGEWLAWLDIDCIMKQPIDDAVSDSYDIGVTFRGSDINSGVTFWRHNNNAINFLEHWCEMSLRLNGDQNGLNTICNTTNQNKYGEILTINEARIKLLSCREYNNFYFGQNQAEAKILHYKTKFRQLFPL